MTRSPESGFSLAELAIVLVIVGLLFVFTLPISSTLLTNEKRSTTIKKMENAQAALVNFVMTNKRLPCPADAYLPITNTAAGVEGARDASGVCTDGQASGVLPWKTVGLSAADATDAWFNLLTYRVGYSLTRDNSLDMSNCDPAGTKASNPATPGAPNASVGLCDITCTGLFSAANCTSPAKFLASKGLNVSDGTGVVMDYLLGSGAAYVLVSHGPNGYGAVSTNNTYQSGASTGVAGTTMEEPNRNVVSVGAGAPPTFFDAPQRDSGNDATTYFDDIVVRPSIMTLINKAQLGPRSH